MQISITGSTRSGSKRSWTWCRCVPAELAGCLAYLPVYSLCQVAILGILFTKQRETTSGLSNARKALIDSSPLFVILCTNKYFIAAYEHIALPRLHDPFDRRTRQKNTRSMHLTGFVFQRPVSIALVHVTSTSGQAKDITIFSAGGLNTYCGAGEKKERLVSGNTVLDQKQPVLVSQYHIISYRICLLLLLFLHHLSCRVLPLIVA